MARYEHLTLKRVGEPMTRRKHGGGGGKPRADRPAHGRKLKADAEALVRDFRASTPKDAVDANLIFKVRLTDTIMDEEWARAGVQLLGYEDDTVVVLFSDDTELQSFRARIDAYSGGVPEGQKGEPFGPFVDAIDAIVPIAPTDRLGPGLRARGITSPDQIDPESTYLVDVEAWRPEDGMSEVVLDRIVNTIEEHGGEELSRYTPPSGLLLRLRLPGDALRVLTAMIDVALIDYPPQPDMEDGGAPQFDASALGAIEPPPQAAVRIGIIDSGINDGHPLLEQVVAGAFGVGGEPAGDDKGHGTAVAAIAAYGDLDAMVRANTFRPQFEIVSARVVDARGRFSDINLAPQLIEEAIRRLHGEFGCRVINISLADPDRPVGRRGTVWSAMLDTLARELDIVIVVAAGNTKTSALLSAHSNRLPDVYPSYLLEDANRILDPAGALNVLTVGSVAHVNGLVDGDGIFIRPLAEFDEPSPFTRRGPGLRGAIKPDFVDYGGTAIYDGARQRLRNGTSRPAAGILSLHHQFTDRLFSTFSGTSFAAPLIAYKAAYLLDKFPGKSANFIRTLLAQSAGHPEASLARLNVAHDRDICSVLGYGRSDLEAALFSDDDRVVLTAESTLAPDQFAVFELPIPDAFQTEKGSRSIRVALAYDPPVRRTRKDYAGIGMQFDVVRGADLDAVFDAFRATAKGEDKPAKLAGRQTLDFSPSISLRKPGSLQCGTFVRAKDMSQYGGTYYLVVRCIGGWAADSVEAQPFSVAVMLQHEAEIRLYERLKVRLDAG